MTLKIEQAPDVIAALAALNGATDALEKANIEISAMIDRRDDLRNNLNQLQRDFDTLVTYLHGHAPQDSLWGYSYGRGS